MNSLEGRLYRNVNRYLMTLEAGELRQGGNSSDSKIICLIKVYVTLILTAEIP